MKQKITLFALSLIALTALTFSTAFDQPRRVIMLTGYWAPTNEMLRPWSKNSNQNPTGWIGENWLGLGYDVVSYFPEFPAGSGERGQGDFEVEKKDTKRDFKRITAEIKPIAIISFGKGDGPWEIETNAPSVGGLFNRGYKNTLPAFEIQKEVNQSTKVRAWVDSTGNAGTFLCGYLSHLGAEYKAEHSSPNDPARVITQGFIHVSPDQQVSDYRSAVEATLKATIRHLDAEIAARR